ncbi:tripartite tricarboxylate transporter substrate binding protein [Bordetella sp. 15P40C-2]|uniref:Bug family tripartite tricarboxylate transporter substrate binding protein n=1 Tax=Bordetella sp. 15P40C-2 TaxID=2572246 RepID=UPI0013254EF4|nr:tripartite tricarboxylate transporter substrate binding protein [Bordetella sp. 15P40C-2]
MWNHRSIKSLIGVAAIAAGLTGAASASAQGAYPQRPVTIVVAFAPGGATDVLARKLAQKLGDHYKQSFVVENKPGAGGNIGTAYAGRAAPDGYTLYLGTVASHGVAPNLYKNVGYDPIKDFAPIGLIAASPQIVVVNKESPIKSIDDLVKHGKSDSSTYASSGAGTTIHLAGEMFNLKAGTKMEHVPFSGSGPAVNALLGGHVDVMFDDMPSSAPHVKAGNLRALAVTGKTRSDLFPDVPTLSEAGKDLGLEGFDVSAWFFLGAPAGIPDAVADSLNQTLNVILAEDDMKRYVGERGAQTLPGSREDASRFIASELSKWNDIITAGNIPKL